MKFCPQHFDFEHTHTFYYFFLHVFIQSDHQCRLHSHRWNTDDASRRSVASITRYTLHVRNRLWQSQGEGKVRRCLNGLCGWLGSADAGFSAVGEAHYLTWTDGGKKEAGQGLTWYRTCPHQPLLLWRYDGETGRTSHFRYLRKTWDSKSCRFLRLLLKWKMNLFSSVTLWGLTSHPATI